MGIGISGQRNSPNLLDKTPLYCMNLSCSNPTWNQSILGNWFIQKTNNEDDLTLPRIPNPDFDNDRLLPIFQAKASDIVFFGFYLNKEDAKGYEFPEIPEQNPDPGYFFVFKEMFGEVHYGLDEFVYDENGPIILDPALIENLDNINWGHMGSLIDSIKFINHAVNFSLTTNFIWNKNSANISSTLLRNPAFICIHAKELLV